MSSLEVASSGDSPLVQIFQGYCHGGRGEVVIGLGHGRLQVVITIQGLIFPNQASSTSFFPGPSFYASARVIPRVPKNDPCRETY